METNLLSEKRTVVVKIQTDLDHHSANLIRKTVDTKIKGTNAINIIFIPT